MRLYYDPATGLVQRWVLTPADDVGTWIDADDADPFSVYVWQGAVHPLPKRPSEFAKFDPANGVWAMDAAAVAADLAAERARIEAMRRADYQIEADPIFFMVQRGEATMADWQDKIAEIKARHPYPTDDLTQEPQNG